VQLPDGYVAGRPAGDLPPARPLAGRPADRSPDDSQSPGAPIAPLRPGEWRPSEDAPPPKRDRDSDDKNREKKPKPIDKHADDWALRKATQNSIAISRPIHVNLYADRIEIVPEAGNGSPKSIPITTSTTRTIDPLVAAIWEQMDAWGMAGKGMYWHPILSIYVAPGAEQRMDDLNRLLRGSGLTLQKKP
jgi:hypothetical protein